MSTRQKPHPARRARRITGAVSAASFLGLAGWFAVHAPTTTTTAASGGASHTGSSATKASSDLDDEIARTATSFSTSASSPASPGTSTASAAHTTSSGS